MTLISLHNIAHSAGPRRLFEKVSFSVDERSRMGLVGLNGCGKSTLLKILARALAPDEGTVVARRALSIRLVEQGIPDELRGQTVLHAIATAAAGYVDQATTAYLGEEWLARLGIPAELWDRPLARLSGGWHSRVLLARALAARPDVIVLDEPTNHMDAEGVEDLEHFLVDDMEIPFCLVSHDRALLDRVTNQTAFLRGGELKLYDGPYSEARAALGQDEAALEDRRAKEEKEIARLETAAKLLSHWGKVYQNEKAARRARSMHRAIDKKRDALPRVVRDKSAAVRLGVREANAAFAVRCRDAVIGPAPGIDLFLVEDFHVRPGDRVAIIGPNGCGKTSFLRRLVGDFASQSGDFRFNPQVALGYYDQLLETLPAGTTVFRYLRDAFAGRADADLRAELIAAGFAYERLAQPLATLSGGERARLKLLHLRLSRPSLLVLDEPTNHIDVEGCEALERELESSAATVVFVSHDRRFVETVATRLFAIRDGELREL